MHAEWRRPAQRRRVIYRDSASSGAWSPAADRSASPGARASGRQCPAPRWPPAAPTSLRPSPNPRTTWLQRNIWSIHRRYSRTCIIPDIGQSVLLHYVLLLLLLFFASHMSLFLCVDMISMTDRGLAWHWSGVLSDSTYVMDLRLPLKKRRNKATREQKDARDALESHQSCFFS